jgi:Domain of unknown function (DUF6285)
MNEEPDARNLLATARDALVAQILPALPGALRYTGLMIANAIAIAQREIETGDTPARAECERLRALLRERSGLSSDEALRVQLAGYNRRLAREIRAGRFDGERRGAMLDHLRRTTEEKLAVSNPKALPAKNRS